MKYGENDLRAIDIFSLVLVGVGILLAAVGVMTPSMSQAKEKPGLVAQIDSETAVAPAEQGKAEAAKKEIAFPVTPTTIMLGIVFICLGAALNMQLRKVVANKGEDLPSGYVTAE
ncbi:MAG: hypothetical protein JXR97_02775 [Planctomycetes bacterium]|nr:hypothetical protein [Planctomycetota bacterium]